MISPREPSVKAGQNTGILFCRMGQNKKKETFTNMKSHLGGNRQINPLKSAILNPTEGDCENSFSCSSFFLLALILIHDCRCWEFFLSYLKCVSVF